MGRTPCLALLAFVCAVSSVADASPARPWPERTVGLEGLIVSIPAASREFAYALISQTHTPARGPYLLVRTNLRTGTVRTGPRFAFGTLAFASGYLWVYGASGSQLRVIEVDPRSLRVLRSIRLLRALTSYPLLAVAGGSGGSVWMGTWGALLRVDAATGAVAARIILSSRLAVAGIAVDPSRRYLYVSVTHVVKGGVEGGAVLEYAAESGRELAGASGGLIRDSTVGAWLTAVPGGVWASFRTGNLGLTIHLRQQGLALIPPPGPGIASRPADSLFHWPMSASTLYGGGALWLANEAGIVACLDPRRGTARAIEHLPPARQFDLLAVDPVSHRLFALDEGRRLVQLTPPQRCWS